MLRPNILWLVTTQWRGQALGYAGDVNACTPCLDAWATRSVNYHQAVTPHPFGPFARAAMLTGVTSPKNGIIGYYDPLPAHARTIAHRLDEHGYETAFFGKWHLGDRDRNAPLVGEAHARTIVPSDRHGGFQFWEGFESGFLLNNPWLHGTRSEAPEQVHGYQSDVICERAAAHLTAASSANQPPWFAMISLEAPHPPYDAPSAGVRRSDPGSVVLNPNVPRGGAVEERARRELAGYYAHIAATDRALGRLLNSIQADATMVVITSVHGDMHGAHGLLRKGWPHEESVRVPFLVSGPLAGSNVGGKSDVPVSLLDLPAFALGWAAGKPAITTRSASTISMPSVVALPHQCDRQWRGVRTPSRKLVLNPDGSPWLLFDLANDPWELRNLVGEAGWAQEIALLRQHLLETNR